MPCTDGRPTHGEEVASYQRRLDKLTRMLCYIMQTFEDDAPNLPSLPNYSQEYLEIEDWWKEHKAAYKRRADAKHIAASDVERIERGALAALKAKYEDKPMTDQKQDASSSLIAIVPIGAPTPKFYSADTVNRLDYDPSLMPEMVCSVSANSSITHTVIFRVKRPWWMFWV